MGQTRLEKIAAMLNEMGADAVMLTSPVNRQYAADFRSSAGICLATKQGEGYFLTDFRYIEAAGKAVEKQGYQAQMIKDNKYADAVNQLIEKHGIKTLAYEDKALSAAEFRQYEGLLKAELLPLEDRLEKIRQIKEPREVEHIVAAQRIAEQAFDQLLEMIRPGVTEQRLAAELNYRMLRLGAQGMSFNIIAVSGANSSMPHGVPTAKEVQAGDFITFDFGALVEGYHSDMTRTVAVDHVTDEMSLVYDTVLRANKAGCQAIQAGLGGRDAHNVTLDIIAAAGYGEYFAHGLGHCVGLEIHESPRASLTSRDVLEVGNVITVEPGIYLPGKFGVRIEDMIWISPEGPVNLTQTPKELLILK